MARGGVDGGLGGLRCFLPVIDGGAAVVWQGGGENGYGGSGGQ